MRLDALAQHTPRAIGTAALVSLSLLGACVQPGGERVQPSPPAQTRVVSSPRPSVPPPATQQPTASVTPILTATASTCDQIEGRILTTQYVGFIRADSLPVWVYLPPCYEQSQSPFPALYLLHGYPMDERHWQELQVQDLLERELSVGRLEPLLLIMPGVPDGLYVGTDGGPGSYEEELMQGLIPFIESQFNVAPEGDQRALAGISRGGVWALEIGLRNPQAFASVAALSPALHVNRARAAYDPYWLIQQGSDFGSCFFLSAGDAEPGFREGTEQAFNELKAQGADVSFLLVQGGHNDATWRLVLPDMMAFISRGWR